MFRVYLYLHLYISTCIYIILYLHVSTYRILSHPIASYPSYLILSIYLYIYLYIYLPTHLSTYLPKYLSVCLFVCLSVCISISTQVTQSDGFSHQLIAGAGAFSGYTFTNNKRGWREGVGAGDVLDILNLCTQNIHISRKILCRVWELVFFHLWISKLNRN